MTPPIHTSDRAYARELGIDSRTLKRAGGQTRLRSLDPSTRAVLLKPHNTGRSRKDRVGGLAARGMRQGVRAIETNPPESYE